MLPSAVAKCFFKKFGRRSYEFKYFQTLCCAGVSHNIQIDSLSIFSSKDIWRTITTSSEFNDKNKAKDAKQPDINKSSDTLIKQSPTGDIIVKTETNSDKVTKVTIEKSKPSTQKTGAPQPGTSIINSLFFVYFPKINI